MNQRFQELRARALKVLQFKGPVGNPTSALLEDLLTLQAELEIQGEELQESQQRALEMGEHYRQIFFDAPVPFLLLTKNLEIREINRGASDLLGVVPHGLNLPFEQFVASEDLSNWRSLVQSQSRNAVSAEVILRAVRGQRLRCRVSMLRRASGDVLLALDDVTEIREAEARQRIAQERYFRILRDSRDAVLIVDAETWLIEDMNDAAVALLGMGSAVRCGTPLREIFSPPERGCYELLMRHAASGRTPPILGLSVMSGGGAKVDVEATVGALIEGPTRFVSLVMRDVSWRRLFAADEAAPHRADGHAGDAARGAGSAEAPSRPTIRRATASAVHGSVLLVDDERAVRLTSARVLRRLGLDVVEANSASEALAAFGSGISFDVVVSDLTMPGMDGEALATSILQARPDQPIIIVTGDIRDDRMHRLQALGVKRVLTKPYTVSDILSALAPHLPVGPG